MKIKKSLRILLLLALLSFVLLGMTGCQEKEPVGEDAVVCSIFPIYDWTKTLLDGVEEAHVVLLVDNGADLHSYQATADDVIGIVSSGLLIYVGGESDSWIQDAAKNRDSRKGSVLQLMEVLGDKALVEELVPGMQGEDEGDEEEEELDEHVWLSIANAKLFVAAIEKELCALYPNSASRIHENAAAYTAELDALIESYRAMLSATENRTILVADRFPFAYFAKEWGLTYYAAFVGCSAESEANFETIKFLADKVDELGLATIFYLDGSDQNIAKTVRETTVSKDQTLLMLESMQSVTLQQANVGETYLGIMKRNLQALEKGLE